MGNIRNIKAIAKDRGVSLSYLCKAINKSHGYLTEFASRDADVPESLLPILAEALNVKVEDLSGNVADAYKQLTNGQVVCKQVNLILARKNLKKSEFYDAVGITAAAFSSWNLGRANPSPETLTRIASYLGVSPEALTAPKEKPTAQGDGRVFDYNSMDNWIDTLTSEQLDLLIAKAAARKVKINENKP